MGCCGHPRNRAGGVMQGGRMPIIHSLSIFLLSSLPPFFLLMELAVDQIKKRTFDYHAFLPEVRNLIVIMSVYSKMAKIRIDD